MGDFIQMIIDGIVRRNKPDDPATREFPTDPAKMFGWGYTKGWTKNESQWIEWGDNLEAAGCNITPIELFMPGCNDSGDPLAENTAAVLGMLPRFIDIMNARGIIPHIMIYNWNVGGEAGWGKSICKYPESYLKGIVDQIITICTGKTVILTPCTEWGSGCRNSQCWKTALNICNYTATKWAGLKAWNQNSRPNNSPTGWINDWHINEVGVLGPKGGLITTDTSKILNWLGGEANGFTNLDRLAILVAAAKEHGCGFSGYSDGPYAVGAEAIKAIGKAWQTQ